MTEHATLTCDEFLDVAAVVALDAGDPVDVQRVEEHALTCADCARHLEDFRKLAALLGTPVRQVDPPAPLRSRVLEAAQREPQVAQVSSRLARFVQRRPRFSAAWLVAAASLIISLSAVVWVASLQGQIVMLQKDAQLARERAARYDRVVEVLASDRLAIRRLQPAAQTVSSTGMVYMDPSSGTGMVMCHNLPPVEQGRAYQIWFTRGNERISGGMLWPDHRGNGYTLIKVPQDLQTFESVGLTDEPGTGSNWPTTPRVIGTPLNQ